MESVSPVFTAEEVQFEREIAKNQQAYIPVIGLPVTLEVIDPKTFTRQLLPDWAIAIRMRLSDAERAAVAAGQDIVITELVFGKQFTPLNVQICPPGVRPVFEVAAEAPEETTNVLKCRTLKKCEPSAEDLDRTAADVTAAEATAGAVTQADGEGSE